LGRERNRKRGRGFLCLRGMREVLGAVGKKREQCLRGMPKEDQGKKESTEEKKNNMIWVFGWILKHTARCPD
jgi:hypothetical protein